jgi:integrase
VRSLGRAGPGEARVLANRLWGATETLFMSLRLNPGIGKTEIAIFTEALLGDLRFEKERELSRIDATGPEDQMFPVGTIAQAYEMDAKATQTALAKNDLAAGDAIVSAFLEDGGTDLSPEDRRLLARAAMRVLSQTEEEAARRIRTEILPHLSTRAAWGNADIARRDALGTGVQPSGSDLNPVEEARSGKGAAVNTPLSVAAGAHVGSGAPVRNRAMIFSALWLSYEADKISTHEWTAPVARQNRSSRKLFIAICGDKPLECYGTLDASTFRSIVLGLPKYYDRAAKYRAMYEADDLAGIVAAAKEAGAKTLSLATFNRHYSALNPLWEFGIRHEALPAGSTSIFKNQFVKRPKKKESAVRDFEQRPMWTDEHLAAVFKQPLFLGCHSRHFCCEPGPNVFRDERYWGILLGAHTGMRREEIFQLKVKHIRMDDDSGIWHADLFSEGLRLKDSGSPRYVPLHRNILDLGFIAARVEGRNPEDMLFPEARASVSDGKHGDLFGKWFGRWRLKFGVPKGMDFHSLRHTVATKLWRTGFSIPFAEEIIGHESAGRRSEFSRYNKKQTLEILDTAIQKIEMPVDVAALKAAIAIGG